MTLNVLFTTERSERHQNANLAAAPVNLGVTMLPSPDKDALYRHLNEADYWVSERSGVIDADLLAHAPRLKLIQRVGSQTHDIDLEAAKRAGVIVCYRPIASSIRVAEHAIMQMLALTKKLPEAMQVTASALPHPHQSQRTDENTFAYNWSGREGIGGLRDKTIGLVGFGEIGVEISRRLRGWDATLLYNKRQRLPESVERELNITYASTTLLTQQSDILVNLLPYTATTDKLIDATWLAALKIGSWVVSVGSGSVIDEAALAAMLASGHLGGAALDTYEYEPLNVDNPLVQLRHQDPTANILLTPHIAAGNSGDNRRERTLIYDNILRHIGGQSLRYRLA